MTTSDDVIAVFEQMNLEGQDLTYLEDACTGLARWLDAAWEDLENKDVQILMTIGATVWRESMLGRRPGDWRRLY